MPISLSIKMILDPVNRSRLSLFHPLFFIRMITPTSVRLFFFPYYAVLSMVMLAVSRDCVFLRRCVCIWIFSFIGDTKRIW